jgi:hypothetical protein
MKAEKYAIFLRKWGQKGRKQKSKQSQFAAAHLKYRKLRLEAEPQPIFNTKTEGKDFSTGLT